MSFLWHGLTDQGAQVPVQVDAQGRVVAVDGTPGVSNWERTGTTLSPAIPGDSVDIGSGNINLDASGTASFTPANSVGVNIDDSGRLLIGTASAGGNSLLRVQGTPANSAHGGMLSLCRGNNPGSIGATLGTISFRRGDTESIGAELTAESDRSWTADTSFPTRLVFSTTSVNSTAPDTKLTIAADGTATFVGQIVAPNVTFRSINPQLYVKKSKNKDAEPEYIGPELDLLAEIARLEALVRHLYETLRLTPPAGWPVWDGNDDVLRQLRK